MIIDITVDKTGLSINFLNIMFIYPKGIPSARLIIDLFLDEESQSLAQLGDFIAKPPANVWLACCNSCNKTILQICVPQQTA